MLKYVGVYSWDSQYIRGKEGCQNIVCVGGKNVLNILGRSGRRVPNVFLRGSVLYTSLVLRSNQWEISLPPTSMIGFNKTSPMKRKNTPRTRH